MEFQGPPRPCFAALQYSLSPGKEVIQSRKALVDQWEFDSLFNAAKDFELALPTAEEAFVGGQGRFGPKLHGFAHNFCPRRKPSKPSRGNLLRIEPAGSADGSMGREEPGPGRRPQHRAAGLHGADTVFNKVFFGRVTADPHAAFGGLSVRSEREGEDRERSCVFGVKERRIAPAEAGEAGFVTSIRLPLRPFGIVVSQTDFPCVGVGVDNEIEAGVRVLHIRRFTAGNTWKRKSFGRYGPA